jgi:hypothetical protein
MKLPRGSLFNILEYSNTNHGAVQRIKDVPTKDFGTVSPFIHNFGLNADVKDMVRSLYKTVGITQRRLIAMGSAMLTWRVEVVSLWLAIGLLISIFIILAKYDGRRRSKTINLNVIVAIMATTLRAAISTIIESGISTQVRRVAQLNATVISQLKWTSYKERRPLRDLSRLDDASRGPWGSFLWVWRQRSLLVST